MENNYWDDRGYYTHSLPASKGTHPPNNATRDPLPEKADGKWPRRVEGVWVLVDDLRGTDYWIKDGTKQTVVELGADIPEGVLLTSPPNEFYTSHDGSSWLMDMDLAKKSLLTAIQREKSRVKNGGFMVDGRLYDSDDPAQIAMTQLSIKMAANPQYIVEKWKASTGVWVRMDAELLADVIAQWETHCNDCFGWQAAKEVEIEQCTTATEMEPFLQMLLEDGLKMLMA